MASSPESSGSASAVQPLDSTLGAAVVGTFLALILYGIVLHQAYQYYVSYPRDHRLLKYYVAVVIVFETLNSMLAVHFCYYYVVTNYFKPDKLLFVVWSAAVLAIIGSITAAISQSFFVHRVWLIGRKTRILVVLSVVFVLLELAVCMTATVKAFQVKTWSAFSEWTYLVSIHGAASTVSDLLLTGVLIYTLRKSRTGIKRTDSMISTLILYAVSTSLITGVFNAICLITSVVLPNDLIYLAATFVGIRLYSNCLLAALNSRRSISERHSVQVAMLNGSPFGVSGRPLAASSYQAKSIEPSCFDAPQSGSSATIFIPDVLDIKAPVSDVPGRVFDGTTNIELEC